MRPHRGCRPRRAQSQWNRTLILCRRPKLPPLLGADVPAVQRVPSQEGPAPGAFVRGTRDVVAALKHRIGREGRKLYDLIDRAGLASAA
ncbi:hypothetical protein E6C72_21810 [Azospirillum sp. TSH100]|nr:hypothetical protein E6C72_21810 [Azospirillum sp. TSH100]